MSDWNKKHRDDWNAAAAEKCKNDPDVKAAGLCYVCMCGPPCLCIRDSIIREMGKGKTDEEKFRIAIKGDRDASFPVVKRVFDILQERQINKFNFITSLEAAPDEAK